MISAIRSKKKKCLANKNATEMKKIITSSLIFSLVLFASCSKVVETEVVSEEPSEVVVNEPKETLNLKVTFGLNNETKAQFSDELGIVWQEGDVVRWEGNTGNTTSTLELGGISNEGHSATFDFEIPGITGQSPQGVFRYNWSSANQSEWNFGNNERQITEPTLTYVGEESISYTQAEAGVMNKSFLFMHSSTSWETIAQSATASNPTHVEMKILGSIFRILPYTKDYNDEAVQSVTLQPRNSSDALGGLVFYNYGGDEYLDQNQKKYNWYKKATVTLGTPFELTSVSDRESSKGIYFSVPATNSPIHGYTISITTDKARYTYSTTSDLNVNEDVVKNIYVKLDAAHRLASSAKEIAYEGGLSTDPTVIERDYHSCSNVGFTYWQAILYNFNGSRVDGMLSAASYPEYYAPTVTITNDSDGTPATWVNLYYRDKNEWLAYDLTENTGETVRKATAVLTYPNVGDNRIRVGFESRTIKFTQTGNVVVTPELANLSTTAVTSDRNVVTATLKLRTGGGAYLTGDDYDTFASAVSLNITPSTASVSRDGTTLNIVIPKNFTTSPIDYTLTADLEGRQSSETIAQAAGAKNYTKVFTWDYDSWQSAGEGRGNRLFQRTSISASGFTQTPDAQGRGAWMLVMNNFKDISTGLYPEEGDKPEIVKFVFDLSDSEYDDLVSWIPLTVSYVGTQVFITLTDVLENTGTYRQFHSFAKTKDYEDFVEVIISQRGADSATPVSEWSNVSSFECVKQYWAGTTAPAIDLSNTNSFTITAPAVKTWGGDWSAQNFILINGPKPVSAKSYTLSFDINSDSSSGIILKLAEWNGSSDVGEFFFRPGGSNNVVAGKTFAFSQDFAGQDRDNFVLIIDLGNCDAGSSWTFSNFDLKYK